MANHFALLPGNVPSWHHMDVSAENLQCDDIEMILSNRGQVAGEDEPDGLRFTYSKESKINCDRHKSYPHKTTILS